MNTVRYCKLLMVEPAAFGYNAQTAVTNRFQHVPEAGSAGDVAGGDTAGVSIAMAARRQFAALAEQLRSAGISVCTARDSAGPARPDAVFPNNWVSFHEDGTLVLYPMQSESRRRERRESVIDEAKARLGFVETRRLDLTGHEHHDRFLEGTGSLVLDTEARVAYACRSPRTNESLVREWARLMDYEPLLFDAAGPDGTPVYHTNVLLWIGARLAGIGLDWIAPGDRERVGARLKAGQQRELMQLDTAALLAFAGNMLEVSTSDGRRNLVMSANAAAALSGVQRAQVRAAGCEPVVAAIPDIERFGGGSVRCMLAEVPFIGEAA